MRSLVFPQVSSIGLGTVDIRKGHLCRFSSNVCQIFLVRKMRGLPGHTLVPVLVEYPWCVNVEPLFHEGSEV